MKQDLWVVVGKADCPWCDKAKALLDRNDIPYTYHGVDVMPDLRFFLKNNGLHTVPQVYRNGLLVGGYDALEAYLGNALEYLVA